MNDSGKDGRGGDFGTDPVCLFLLTALIVAWFARPFLWPHFIGYDGDSLFLWLPAQEFARTEILAGRFPLWNPYRFFGVPMMADALAPVFYPPHLLGLILPQPLGLHVTLVLNALLGGWFAYAAARKGFGVGPMGALMAGLTFSLGAHLMAHRVHLNDVRALVWLPLVLLFSMRIGKARRWWRSGIALGIILGLQVLAGQPQYLLYSAVIGCVVFFGELMRYETKPSKLLGAYVVAGAIAIGLSAVQFFPLYELSEFSVRRHLKFHNAASFSLPFENLFSLILPGAFLDAQTGEYRGEGNFTETAIFIGQMALALAFVGALGVRRGPRRWLLIVLAGLGTLLALGRYTPFYAFLAGVFPPLIQFRAPARAFCITALALAILAGMGLDAAMAFGRERLDGRGRRFGASLLGWIMIGLQLAGLAYFGFKIIDRTFTDARVVDVPGIERLLNDGEEANWRVFRLLDEIDYNDPSVDAVRAKVRYLQPDINALKRIRVIGGYEGGLMPGWKYAQFMRHFIYNLFYAEPDPVMLGLMGVRYLLTDKPIQGDRLRKVGALGGVAIFENLDYRGEVFTRGDWPGVDFDLLGRDYGDAHGIDPVPIVTSPVSLGAEKDRFQRARIEYRRVDPKTFDVVIREGDPGEILLSEGWMPGWVALTDGGDRIRGEYAAPFLISFRLPPGVHRLQFVYRPKSFYWGLAVSSCTLIFLVTLILSTRPKPKFRSR